tara:strand:+ start:144 stop:482 length:339 start_codon:yes stop_codon:yes gene_type:complete
MKYFLKKMSNKTIIFYAFLIIFSLNGCGSSWDSFEKAVTGQKETSTDEFLIKKKDPLILPPEYEKLPIPGNQGVDSNSDSIKSILKGSSNTKKASSDISELENQILRELRKR